MLEIWKDVKGYEGQYQVSNLGNVKSLDIVKEVFRKDSGKVHKQLFKGQSLKPQPNSKGYLRIGLGSKLVFIHRLVAEHFVDNPESKPYVNHKNGQHTDNVYTNLEWMTNSENLKHAYKEGHAVSKKGEDHHGAVLTEAEVRWILTNYVKGSYEFGRKPLARKFGVSHQTIKYIIDRKKWKHVQL